MDATANAAEESINRQIEEAGAKERVSLLDPDFLGILLVIAIPFDILMAAMEFIGLFTGEIPKIIAVPLDLIPFTLIMWWSMQRTGRIVQAREEQKKAMQGAISKRGAAFEKKLGQSLTKRGAGAATRRVLLRGGVALLGVALPFVAFFPFWTLTVILTLREK